MTAARSRHLAFAVLVLGGAVLMGCSSTSEQVSDEITEKVTDQLDLKEDPTVECPDDAEAGKGKTFTCTMTLDGKDIDIDVKFTDDTTFEATPVGNVFGQDELETYFTQGYAQASMTVSSVDCPGGENVVFAPDTEIDCTIETDQGSFVVTLGVDEEYQPKVINEQPA